MSDVIDWGNAPEWADKHGFTGAFKSAVWFNDEKYSYVDRQQDGKEFFYCDACTYKSKDFSGVTARPQPTQWSGEGLPPVGTVCGHVVSGDKDYPFIEWAGGDKLEVIAHREVCGVILPIVFNLRHNTATAIQPHLLKPIRTPEQIAADERHEAIKEMRDLALGRMDIVGAGYLYDAGYRRKP